MHISEMMIEEYERIGQSVRSVLDGIDDEGLKYRVDPDANTIAWLVWHLTRVQDDHISGVSGDEQVWTKDGWNEQFKLPFDDDVIGYGQSSDEVAQVKVSADLLLGYYDAVHKQTTAYLLSLTEDDYDRVVDTSWDPPVTLGVRLASVLSDDLQHAGQAAFVKGLYERR